MEMKHKKAEFAYTARIPFYLFPWKSHKSVSFGGGIVISISILFEDTSYFRFFLFSNFYSLSLWFAWLFSMKEFTIF